MSTIEEHYSSEEQCKQEIVEARKIFGNKTTTREQFDAMQKALGLMYLYCPENMQGIVKATLNESVIRETHFKMYIW